MLHGDAVKDRTGQGVVHHPEAHLGAVLDAGAAQEPFQPGLAVRQEQQGALPFAGGRLQEHAVLPVYVLWERASLPVELLQLHTVVIDHPIGGDGPGLIEDQLQCLLSAVHLGQLVHGHVAAAGRQDVPPSDRLQI